MNRLTSHPVGMVERVVPYRDVFMLPVGLYESRVEALDSGGALIGTPSDWSYLIRR
jgi:hypothetical protein